MLGQPAACTAGGWPATTRKGLDMDELLDALKKLSREGQVVLGGLVLFLILSFFDWQQVSGFGVTVGKNLWNGFGIIVILVAIVFLVWEVLRLLERAPNLG